MAARAKNSVEQKHGTTYRDRERKIAQKEREKDKLQLNRKYAIKRDNRAAFKIQ